MGDQTCELRDCFINQSPDIADGVRVGKEDPDAGAGDQGIIVGDASEETEECKLLSVAADPKIRDMVNVAATLLRNRGGKVDEDLIADMEQQAKDFLQERAAAAAE